MMAMSMVRRVLKYSGAIFVVLLLGAPLASFKLLDIARETLLPHGARTTLTPGSLPQNTSTFCQSSFMASHTALRSYLCSGLGGLLPREVGQVVPPLGETGCEELHDLERLICNGQFVKTLIIVASVSAGIIVLVLCILVVWTVASWIITVRLSYRKRKGAQFARAMDKSRKSRGIIGTEESLEEGTMKYPPLKERPARRAQKYVLFQGVRALLPWGKGSEWSQAVSKSVHAVKIWMADDAIQEVEVVKRGIMPGFMVGMTPPQINMDVIEPGELERGDVFSRYSSSSSSEDIGSDGTTRVVSTGHETTGLGPMEVRKRSGRGDGFPEL
jgi:hypothetical protein